MHHNHYHWGCVRFLCVVSLSLLSGADLSPTLWADLLLPAESLAQTNSAEYNPLESDAAVPSFDFTNVEQRPKEIVNFVDADNNDICDRNLNVIYHPKRGWFADYPVRLLPGASEKYLWLDLASAATCARTPRQTGTSLQAPLNIRDGKMSDRTASVDARPSL